jgi:Fibronectin type III domain
MRNAKRGSGSHRWIYGGVAAALGFALSACGGGAAGSGSTQAVAATSPPAASPSATSPPASSPAASSLPTASSQAVTLNWLPPTQNTDGTALMNLTGYDIHYGRSSGYYTKTITITNPGIATYVVDNLTPGTYYFSVSAVNAHGVESPLSPEVTATVN